MRLLDYPAEVYVMGAILFAVAILAICSHFFPPEHSEFDDDSSEGWR